MATVSDTVQNRVKELYAILATAAAKRALRKVENEDADAAEMWAKHAEKWLVRAGAINARYTYEKPRP